MALHLIAAKELRAVERSPLDIFKPLENLRTEAMAGGSQKLTEVQHGKGKLTARERTDLLLDEGSFEEFDILKVGRGNLLGEQRSFLNFWAECRAKRGNQKAPAFWQSYFTPFVSLF